MREEFAIILGKIAKYEKIPFIYLNTDYEYHPTYIDTDNLTEDELSLHHYGELERVLGIPDSLQSLYEYKVLQNRIEFGKYSQSPNNYQTLYNLKRVYRLSDDEMFFNHETDEEELCLAECCH